MQTLNKIKGSLITVIGHTAQVLVTAIFGMYALLAFTAKADFYVYIYWKQIAFAFFIIHVFVVIGYIRIDLVYNILSSTRFFNKIEKYIIVFKSYSKTQLTKVLLFSICLTSVESLGALEVESATATQGDVTLEVVGDAFVGMEVVDTRLADFKSADPDWLLADNQMNHALVVGDSIEDWKSLDWANLQVRQTIDGKVEVDQKGGLGAVDPVRPLAWMIDHAVRHRGGLRAGQAITTGSWTGLRYYPPGTNARGEFIGLGSVEATF